MTSPEDKDRDWFYSDMSTSLGWPTAPEPTPARPGGLCLRALAHAVPSATMPFPVLPTELSLSLHLLSGAFSNLSPRLAFIPAPFTLRHHRALLNGTGRGAPQGAQDGVRRSVNPQAKFSQ